MALQSGACQKARTMALHNGNGESPLNLIRLVEQIGDENNARRLLNGL